MSALAPRNSFRTADEPEWLESSDIGELSPASLWAPDYEEDDEITLQGRRADSSFLDLTSPNLEEEQLFIDTPRQVRRLDESQVLPGEASFATVRLNQPFEESVPKLENSWETTSTSGVDDNREGRAGSRVKLLDESQILAGEASFATVISGEHLKSRRHSPISEFLVKTKLSLTQLALATLALVLVCALSAIVLWIKLRPQVVRVSSAPAAVDTGSQSVSTSVAAPSSTLIANSQGEVSGSVDPTGAVESVEEKQGDAASKSIEGSGSDDSGKTPLSDSESVAVRQENPKEVNATGVRVSSPKERVIETKKQPEAVKDRATVKTPDASVRTEPREKTPEPAARKTEAAPTIEKVETKTPPITGGGERPRTVTRKPSP